MLIFQEEAHQVVVSTDLQLVLHTQVQAEAVVPAVVEVVQALTEVVLAEAAHTEAAHIEDKYTKYD